MKKTLLFVMLGLVPVLMVATACTDAQRQALQTMVAPPTNVYVSGSGAGTATPSPFFSALSTPTLSPLANGPMGTLTAIAYLFVSPTPNPEPYVIVNRGVPHFIEFHAWW